MFHIQKRILTQHIYMCQNFDL